MPKTARQMFKELGYKQKTFNYKSKKLKMFNGIQYIQKGDGERIPEDELKYCGSITTKTIEIYFRYKEICIYTEQEFSDGKKCRWREGMLNYKEFKAIQKKIEELECKEVSK